VLLVGAGAAAYAGVKLAQKDADRIEKHTGISPEELTEEELQSAMNELGIESLELDDDDRAALSTDEGTSPAEPAAETSYLDELERLAELHDRGIINDEEFEAKKGQLLGI
jgi:hypothetical protein